MDPLYYELVLMCNSTGGKTKGFTKRAMRSLVAASPSKRVAGVFLDSAADCRTINAYAKVDLDGETFKFVKLDPTDPEVSGEQLRDARMVGFSTLGEIIKSIVQPHVEDIGEYSPADMQAVVAVVLVYMIRRNNGQSHRAAKDAALKDCSEGEKRQELGMILETIKGEESANTALKPKRQELLRALEEQFNFLVPTAYDEQNTARTAYRMSTTTELPLFIDTSGVRPGSASSSQVFYCESMKVTSAKKKIPWSVELSLQPVEGGEMRTLVLDKKTIEGMCGADSAVTESFARGAINQALVEAESPTDFEEVFDGITTEISVMTTLLRKIKYKNSYVVMEFAEDGAPKAMAFAHDITYSSDATFDPGNLWSVPEDEFLPEEDSEDGDPPESPDAQEIGEKRPASGKGGKGKTIRVDQADIDAARWSDEDDDDDDDDEEDDDEDEQPEENDDDLQTLRPMRRPAWNGQHFSHMKHYLNNYANSSQQHVSKVRVIYPYTRGKRILWEADVQYHRGKKGDKLKFDGTLRNWKTLSTAGVRKLGLSDKGFDAAQIPSIAEMQTLPFWDPLSNEEGELATPAQVRDDVVGKHAMWPVIERGPYPLVASGAAGVGKGGKGLRYRSALAHRLVGFTVVPSLPQSNYRSM